MPPLRGAGPLRCASSRCQKPSASPLRAAIPYAGSPPPPPRTRRRAGRRRTVALWPCRCARQCSDQGCALLAMRNSHARPAMPAGMTTAARSRARGSRAWFSSRVRERGPLDELPLCARAARHFAALRCAPLHKLRPCQIVTPVTRHARCLAAERLEVIGPARPPRQSLTFGSLGVTSAAEAPDLRGWVVVFAATAAPNKLAHRPRRCVDRNAGQRVRQSSQRAPPTAPPSSVRGTCGGSSSGGPGKCLTASAAEEPDPSPHPLP